MDDCVFCKIVQGEIPAEKVYEDDHVLAFLDIQPFNPGHTLIIPKEHYRGFFETPDDALAELMNTAKKVGIAVKKAAEAEGMNISTNIEKAGGQMVFHTHFHIIPRYSSDGLQHWNHKEYADGEAKKYAEKIREKLY